MSYNDDSHKTIEFLDNSPSTFVPSNMKSESHLSMYYDETMEHIFKGKFNFFEGDNSQVDNKSKVKKKSF